MNFDESALQLVRERRSHIARLDNWIFELIRPFVGDRVLDVGCGYGNMLQHLVDKELACGIDTSEESVAHVLEIFDHRPNIIAFKIDVTEPGFLNLGSYGFDTIISINTFEHIDADIFSLIQIKSVLKTGGRMILVVPAFPILYGTLDQSIGHVRRYTMKAMSLKLHQAGFKIIYQRYLNLLGALGWYVNGRLLRVKVPPVRQLKLFNLLMPLVAKVENRINLPFGLSLLSISEKAD